MDYNVEETMAQESAQTDATLAPVQEEEDIASLNEAFGGTTEAEEGTTDAAEPQEEAVEQPGDSKGIKVRLKAFETKGYKRGREEAQKAWEAEKADYEAKLAKLTEYELKEDAAKLAKEENISEALALRLLRAERGISAPVEQKPAASTPERDAQGRFVAKPKENPRVQELYKEAQVLESAIDGLSVSKLLENATDEQKAQLMSGDLSMGDFVKAAMAGTKRTPAVVHSPGATNRSGVSIANMSKDEFKRLDEALSSGQAFRI